MDPAPPISKLRRLGRALKPFPWFLLVGFIVGWPVGWQMGRLSKIMQQGDDTGNGGRYIRDARMIYERDHPDGLPPEALADIYAYAACLAHAGELNDSRLWFSRLDLLGGTLPDSILSPSQNPKDAPINPGFQGAPLTWAVALMPSVLKLPPQTPWLWTRGLQSDGSWRKDSPYGGEGGVICYAGGNAKFFSTGASDDVVYPLKWGTEQPTSNILEALPPGTRISEYTPTVEDQERIKMLAHQHARVVATKALGWLLFMLACNLVAVRAQNRWVKSLGLVMKVVGAVCFWFVLAF
jgi:hypothetical protein